MHGQQNIKIHKDYAVEDALTKRGDVEVRHEKAYIRKKYIITQDIRP
jgi:hypothetical protein